MSGCPKCGGCDGFIRADDEEPIFLCCREHRTRWRYVPTDDEDDARHPSSWRSAPSEAACDEALTWDEVEPGGGAA